MPQIESVKDQIAWSYANLARAHAALADGCKEYEQRHHMIRSKLFKGLKSGRMTMRSIYDDERLKLTLPRICAYCGTSNHLTLDHLIPRSKRGLDDADNLVWACRSCNSSKRGRDVLSWMHDQNKFPSIYVLRRYLKLAARTCEALGIMNETMDAVRDRDLPFSLDLLPSSFPPLGRLTLWVVGSEISKHPGGSEAPVSP